MKKAKQDLAEEKAARLLELEHIATLKKEKSELEAKVTSLEADKKKLKVTVSKINKASFNNAVSHFSVVNPGLNAGLVGYKKVVSGGKDRDC